MGSAFEVWSMTMSESAQDVLAEEPEGEIVHWMEPRPLTVGPAGITAATAGAFVLGAASAVAILALMRWLGPQRAMLAPGRWRLH
jgi:uncharacterized protein (DUF2345 family)